MKLGAFRDSQAALADIRRVVARFNDNRTPYPRERSVPGLFAEQAAARPQAVAVMNEQRSYSYRELDEASNRFARLLLEQGLQAEDRVGVMLDDAFASIAVILGTLKAGGAYVPIDPRTPQERIRYLLDDTQARLLAVQRRDIRIANRLHWECPHLQLVFCVDSQDAPREPESVGLLMQEPIWNHAVQSATDDITAGGWTSSYTGEPLSREVMDGYADNIRAKLLPYLTPATRVLEVAVGSAISLRRLAPLVGHYCATDLSRAAVEWSAREVQRDGLHNVVLHHAAAHEIDRLEEGGFDVVVMNSVIQCFSGYNYLRDVIGKAIAKMGERGVMFLGHLLDLQRREGFIASLTEFRRRHADRGMRTKVERSEDLFIPRAFLEDLRHDFPEIGAIECSALLGEARSELSDFGYDAILHIDKRCKAAPAAPRLKRQLDLRALERCEPQPVGERATAQSLAYVIYTSGTSGRPKGVMVEHRGIVRMVRDTDYVKLGPDERILQTASPAFDAATFEIWGALLNGGTLVRPAERATLDPAELGRLVKTYGITTMFLTTGLFHQHVDSGADVFAGLGQLVVGGERMSARHANLVRERWPALALVNGYGPTENTTFTTAHAVTQRHEVDVPIGRPIANTQVLILDAQDRPVAVGVQGEICAAGDGLARGYIGDEALTRLKFVPHPWESGQRMYRTGDAGVWRADGTIEYLGRLDGQVKIRGFRVEPAEVEHHIQQDAAIRQAHVLALDGGTEGHTLVAYVVPDEQAPADAVDALRERLRHTLPDYMVPAHVVALPRLPLNANGKVDAKALRELPLGGPGQAEPQEQPTGALECELAQVFQEVLGQPRVGATDDFFQCGGHSLKVTKAVSLIERRLGVAVPLKTFFMHPTVRGLAEHIVQDAAFGVEGVDETMVPLKRTGTRAVFALPPGTGDALGYVQLAALLPYRFYGFNFIEAESRVSDYATLIQAADPSGPYVLLGYSAGGNLAFQVAHELERRGGRVAAVVMVDSARQLQPWTLPQEEVERASEAFLGDPSVQPYLSSPVLHEKARRLTRAALRHAGRTVDVQKIAADIHVLGSEGGVEEWRADDGTLVLSQAAWADATAGRCSLHPGYGEHNRMLLPPFLERNAALIQAIVAGTTGVKEDMGATTC